MTIDATGHGTRDTRDTLRPAFPRPTPEHRPAFVPLGDDAWEGGNGYGTEDALRDGALSPEDVPPATKRNGERDTERNVPSHARPKLVSRLWARHTASRASRARSAEQRDTLERASRAARDAERDCQRDALSRAAVSRRNMSRARTAEQRDEMIAPIPPWMKIIGVWIDRTFGAIPLIAPLIVSGYFTMHVFTDAPLAVAWGIALCITLALEGGVWKLSRLYEKTLLEGDSTIGIRLVIGLYLALISGMIYGHAYYVAWSDAAGTGGADASRLALDWSKWGPAAGVAIMSFLGVMVWSKQARYQHRVKLRDQGQVDPRAPKFATLAWVMTFRETLGSLRHSVKFRISSPEAAVNDWRLYRAAGRPPIWPIPVGFAWINGTLIQTDPLEGRDVQDAVPLETERRPALGGGTGGTPERIINGTSRDSVPQLTAGQNGTRNSGTTAGQNGTSAAGDGTPTHGDSGTRDTDGTRDGGGTPQDGVDESADILKYDVHLLAVTEAFPHWRTGPLPSVRKITAAIDQYRREKDGGSFNSNGISAKVQEALGKLQRRPDLIDVIRMSEHGEAK